MNRAAAHLQRTPGHLLSTCLLIWLVINWFYIEFSQAPVMHIQRDQGLQMRAD